MLLTAKEHFICHHLLTKFVNGKRNNYKMDKAFAMICQKTSHGDNRNDYNVTSRVFENNRIRNAEAISNRIVTEETRAKMSIASKLRMSTPEARGKASIANTGKIHSDETRAKLKESNLKSAKYGRDHKDADKTIYRFHNCKLDETFIGSKYDLANKLNIPHRKLAELCRGVRKSYKAEWMIWKPNTDKPYIASSTRKNIQLYNFYHVKTKETFYGTIDDMKSNGCSRNDILSHIKNPNENRSVNNWIIWDGDNIPTYKGKSVGNNNNLYGMNGKPTQFYK